jgi:hypothetical protein
MDEKKDKEEPAKIYLAVRGKPKITDKKTFNLILPKNWRKQSMHTLPESRMRCFPYSLLKDWLRLN